MTDCKDELLPLVDQWGNIVGTLTRQEAHNGTKLLHPVVHLHLFNSQGELYLQHRPKWKDVQPDKWDTACGGHVDLGESIEQALRREVKEELQITDFEPEPLGSYIFESDIERELIFSFRCVYDNNIIPSPTELDGGRFWSLPEIMQQLGQDRFTPNFESEFQRFFCHK